MRLASHLRMSLQRCQEETSSTEFLDWLEYLRQDINVHRREDYYLANIAKEIRRTITKDRQNIKLEPFLLEFETKTITEKKKRTNTLGNWLTWAGIKAKE